MAEHRRIEQHGKIALIRGADVDAIATALLGKAETIPLSMAGRGEVATFRIADGEGVLRPCRRGGLVGRFVREGYAFGNRPLSEFRVHEHLFEAGLPVPEPLGVMWRRRGIVVRGAIATRRLVAAGLREPLGHPNPERSAMLEAAGRLIRAMHDAGVYHADLNVDNILVSQDGVFLIDFDKAVMHSPLSVLQRARNLLRLRRSFQKNGLTLSEFESILAGYGPITFPAWLDAAYRLKGKASDLLAAS